MSKFTIQRCFPDNDVLTISLKLDDSYPDSHAEAKRVVMDAYAEAMEPLVAADDDREALERAAAESARIDETLQESRRVRREVLGDE